MQRTRRGIAVQRWLHALATHFHRGIWVYRVDWTLLKLIYVRFLSLQVAYLRRVLSFSWKEMGMHDGCRWIITAADRRAHFIYVNLVRWCLVNHLPLSALKSVNRRRRWLENWSDSGRLWPYVQTMIGVNDWVRIRIVDILYCGKVIRRLFSCWFERVYNLAWRK